MNILIDIGHPAHIHYFKYLGEILEARGNNVFYSAKDSPAIKKLLDNLGYDYFILPKKSDSLSGKIVMQLYYDWLLYKFCKKNKIDYALGVSVTISHISRISKIVSFLFDDDDDDVQPLFVKWAHPFATELLSPDILRGKQKRKDVVYYPGYHELAYLHPNRFSPDESVLTEAGLRKEEPFFVLRFNAFKAHHDIGAEGISREQQSQLIQKLSTKGRVLITSERELPAEFEKFRISVPPEKIHSLLYYAKIFIGDSQTMTSEAAVLGTPSIRCNSFAGKISYLEEEEHKYGLTFGFKPAFFDDVLKKVDELLNISDLKQEWKRRQLRMLEDKIDVTSFWVWFIENYPNSPLILKKNPNFPDNFK